VIGAERDLIVKEQAEEEARIRNAKLEELRRRRYVMLQHRMHRMHSAVQCSAQCTRLLRAAITLQRAWRQYKVLQQQSKKKKKGKKK
jgi:hypothetical protein